MAFRSRIGILFIVPVLIIVLVVGLYPLIYQIYISFTDWYPLVSPVPSFHGLDGYERLFRDSIVWASLARTVVWVIGTVVLEYVVALPIALLLNRRTVINGVLSGLILLPWVTPSIVIAYVWMFLFNSNFGAVHYFLQSIGFVGERSLLSDPSLVMPALVIVSAWKGIPFMTLGLLAALKNIPPDVYEAASVDGANAWQRLIYITLPFLRRVSVVLILILGILAFYSFDLVWVITKGGPGDSSTLIGVYLYRNFFERQEFSYAGTIGVLMLILLISFSIIYLRIVGRQRDQVQ